MLWDDTGCMKRLVVPLAFALVALACAPPGPPPTAPPPSVPGVIPPARNAHLDDARVRAIADAFDVTLGAATGCPEKIWPGHDGDDNAIVLRRFADDRAWVWTSDGTAEVDPATLPLELRDFGFFSTGVLDGQVALGIDLDGTEDLGVPLYTDFAIHLALHEGFHFLGGQDAFTGDTFGRDPSLPVPAEPRFVRERLIDALSRTLRAGAADEGALAEAAYWHARHARDFADDASALAGLDVVEGTAQYVETLAVVVAQLGCDATDAEIAAEVAAHLDELSFDPGYDGGSESYVIGPLAGVLLRARDGQGFEEAARSTPLHALLLADVEAAAVDEAAHADARAAAEGVVASANEAALDAVAPVLSAWDDVANVRLALPTDALVGSFGYGGGFFLSERPDELHVLLDLFASFAPSDGEAALDAVTVVEDFTACGTNVFAVALDPALATREGDVVTFSAAAGVGGVDVAGVTVEDVVRDGATWWCVR